MYINKYLQWRQDKVWLNGHLIAELAGPIALDNAVRLYQQSAISYPKFFKMDLLSKVAFLCAELLGPYPENLDRNSTATMLSTASGCLSVDKKFEESRKTLASPALFVYTLPNIMLGEICIRHGFKGEQICTIEQQANTDITDFQVTDLMTRRGTTACMCGHVEATEHNIEATMIWVTRERSTASAIDFSPEQLNRIFKIDS